MELLLCTALPPVGRRQCNSCQAPPHCLGPIGSGTPITCCHSAQGQRAVELLQWIAAMHGGSGQCNSCNTLPHCLGAVGNATPAMHRHTAWGRWAVELLQCVGRAGGETGSCARRRSLPKERNSCNAPPQCLGAVGGGTRVMQCHSAQGQWAVRSATPPMSCLFAWGKWAMQLLQYTASLPGGSGECDSCTALAHRLGAVGSETPAMFGPTNWGDGESALRGGRSLKKRYSCNALPHILAAVGNTRNARPHCLGSVGTERWSCRGGGRCLKSGTRAINRVTAWGWSAV